jgi:hypothetical protein
MAIDAGYDNAVSESNRYQEIALDVQSGKEHALMSKISEYIVQYI